MNLKYILLSLFAFLLFTSVEAQEQKRFNTKGKQRVWKLNVGDVSPLFTYKDIKGKDVSLIDFRGKYVYIDVWGTWCGTCLKQLDHMKQLEKSMKGKNIVFIALSLDTDKAAWKRMVKKRKWGGIHLNFGGDTAFKDAYEITYTPRVILLDKEGKILSVRGALHPSNPKILEILNKLEGI